ncbi:MAG: ribonuclease Z [Chitinophagaceae bacterium]|nr:ribonuclease Z [Chitinophagaceae bacterium]
MIFEVTILGSNSALPAHGRHPTAQVLNHHDKLFLLDCGEGTQIQLSAYRIKRSKINEVFISHLHGDHYYGLLGLLTSYHLLKRMEPLHLYCPKGLKDIIDLNFRYSDTRLAYELIVHEIDCSQSQQIYENSYLTVTTIPMKHRIACCGFLFREKERDRVILPEKLRQYEVPHTSIGELKYGKDILVNGVTIPNAELTQDPPLPRAYAFCSDTIHSLDFVEQVKEVNLLYHEATFMEESAERATLTFHSTTKQAATVAKKAKAKKLLIGHFSAKYDNLQLLLDETKTLFPATEIAVEGQTYKVEN